MSEEQGRSRLQKRAKQRNILAGDSGTVDALVQRLKQSGKGSRGARRSSRASLDLARKAQRKRGRPLGE